jgi:hypothetical protein
LVGGETGKLGAGSGEKIATYVRRPRLGWSIRDVQDCVHSCPLDEKKVFLNISPWGGSFKIDYLKNLDYALK